MTHAVSWTAPIRVSDHAVARAAERLGERMTAEEIAAEVRVALLYDRICERRPGWTRDGGRTGRAAHRRERFAWNEEATRCWVLFLVDGSVVVKTVLADRAHAAVLAGRRLRR